MLNNTTIKKRLTLLITAISSIAVIATTVIITIVGIFNMKDNLIEQLEEIALSVGQRNLAHISLGTEFPIQQESVRKNIYDVFSVKPSIQKVCVYDAFGKEFTGYFSESSSIKNCPDMISGKDAVIKINGNTGIIKNIDNNHILSAVIYIESDMREIRNYLIKQIITALLVILMVIICSYLIALAMQRKISVPILKLAETARRISVEEDYTLRVESDYVANLSNENEISVLIHSFNAMLDEIQERDRTLLKQNEELGKAKKDAESASIAKSNFLANISHELRTPLNAIIGFSSVFKEQLFGKLGSEKYMEYANDINNAGVHLLDIINDILDLSKAESGKMVMVFEKFDMERAIAKCFSIMEKRAQEGGIALIKNIPENMPYIVADRVRFAQILLNILSNAIKFTSQGGSVSITVLPEMRHGIITDFIIKIKDTGIGIARENISRVFQSFDQVDSGLNRKYNGTGLGLPLTRNLVELHHGKIFIESDSGQGTEVTLHFLADPTAIQEILDYSVASIA